MLEMIIGALILLVGVVVGFGISSASTEKALDKTNDMTTHYNGDVTNNYGEMQPELTYDEGTLFKVRKVLADELATDHLDARLINDIIAGFHNEGVLFRERAKGGENA